MGRKMASAVQAFLIDRGRYLDAVQFTGGTVLECFELVVDLPVGADPMGQPARRATHVTFIAADAEDAPAIRSGACCCSAWSPLPICAPAGDGGRGRTTASRGRPSDEGRFQAGAAEHRARLQSPIVKRCSNRAPPQQAPPGAVADECPGGRGSRFQLPLNPSRRPQWVVATDWLQRASISPSVLQPNGCRAHFWVRDGQIEWCRDSAPH